MGRGKLNMKFIKKEKLRVSTYQKRKKGLIKKAEEFSILCGVETCVIIYGPKLDDSHVKLEIWPSDPVKVMTVINKYKRKPLEVCERKYFNVFDYFAIRQKKLDDEICKLRKANMDAKFSSWDDRINSFSVNQIWALLARFDSKLEAAKKMIKMIKEKDQCLVEDSTKSGILAASATQVIQPGLNLRNQSPACFFQKNLDFEVTSRQQPMSGLKTFDMNVPSYYPLASREALQMQPFNLNPFDNSMTMPCRNGSDYTQVDGESSSSITYSSLSPQACYDPMLDNVMCSNPWGVPISFYSPFMQPMTPFGQPAMTSFPSQFDDSYRDIGDQYGSKNKK